MSARKRLLASLLFAFPLVGAELTGVWVGQIPVGRNGELQDIAFQFAQKDTVLRGKLYGDYQSTRISEGKVTGDEVSFVVIVAEQAGNQINETRLRFTGTLKDGELELTREREGATNAGNGGAVQFRNNSKQSFKLKRLI
jgi:hypothetical protein